MADLVPTIQSTARDPQSVRAPQPDGNATQQSATTFLGLLTSAMTGATTETPTAAMTGTGDTVPRGPANPASGATACATIATPASSKADPVPLQFAGPAPRSAASPVVSITAPAHAAPSPSVNPALNSSATGVGASSNPARSLTPIAVPATQITPPKLDSVAPSAQLAAAEPAATLTAGPTVAVSAPASPASAVAAPAIPNVGAAALGQNTDTRPSPTAAPQSKTAVKSGSGSSSRSTRDTSDPGDAPQDLPLYLNPAVAVVPLAAPLAVQQPPPKAPTAALEPAAVTAASPSQAQAATPFATAAEPRSSAAAASAQADTSLPTAAKPSPTNAAAESSQTFTEALSASAAPTPPSHAAAQPLATSAPARSVIEPEAATQTPAVQVAQAIAEPVKVTLASAPQQQPGAAHVMTIHLAPSDLGRVDIRIERPTDGPAKIELQVERPETLQRLMHDQPQLQQALDQAGIPQSGRTIQFNLSSDTGSSSNPGTTLAGDGGSNGGGQRSQQGYPGSQSRTTEQIDAPATFASWARAGLDITA